MVFGLFGGGDVQIGVDVDERAGGFGPGDTLQARIALDAGKGLKAREVRAGLVIVERYETTDEYRDNDGDSRTRDEWKTDETWVRREVLARDDVPAGQQSYSFAWPIPTNAPPPCAGKIVQVRYLVKVTVDRKLARDINAEREIHSVCHAPGRNGAPVELGSSGDNEARMWFSLPRLEFLEGETIQGMLHIEPYQSYGAREIRVQLSRVETVFPGDRTHRESIAVTRAPIAPGMTLQPGVSLHLPFEITIPALGCPSHATGKTQVSWILEGVIDRAMQDDTNVQQEIGVYTAPPHT